MRDIHQTLLRTRALGLVGAVAMLAFLCAISPANAGIVVNITQQGSDVVASGSGSIDLSGLTLHCSYCGGQLASITASPYVAVNIGSATDMSIYNGLTGPLSLGPGYPKFPTSWTGDTFALFGEGAFADWGALLWVPGGYSSGAYLSGSDTFDNTTLVGLGLSSGTYTWTWGSGATADSFIVNIGNSVVPESPSLALFGGGLLAIGILVLYRRRIPARHS